MQDQPLASILINNYNYGQYLKDAIESALNQTYSPIEVIVVDDGSTDNSREIIASYGDRIIPILKANGGQASAFNAGFLASKGDILCFLDSDDVFKPNKVEKVVRDFQKDKNIGWHFHSLEFFGDNRNENENKPTEKAGVYDLRPYIKKGKLRGSLPFEINTATSAICFDRSLLTRILPMPEEIKITSDDYLKYAALGTSKGFVSFQLLTQQRIHNDNAYTLKPNNGNSRAKTQIVTAYVLRQSFPELSEFSDNLLSMGISICWWIGELEPESKKFMHSYLSSVSFIKRIKIYAKAVYYRFGK